jgi:phosphoglycerate dehydrogenase-like enzyme
VLKVGLPRTFPASREQGVPRHPAVPGEITHPFHPLPNGLITPHVSCWTNATRDARAKQIAATPGRVARRDILLNLVTL